MTCARVVPFDKKHRTKEKQLSRELRHEFDRASLIVYKAYNSQLSIAWSQKDCDVSKYAYFFRRGQRQSIGVQNG